MAPEMKAMKAAGRSLCAIAEVLVGECKLKKTQVTALLDSLAGLAAKEYVAEHGQVHHLGCLLRKAVRRYVSAQCHHPLACTAVPNNPALIIHYSVQQSRAGIQHSAGQLQPPREPPQGPAPPAPPSPFGYGRIGDQAHRGAPRAGRYVWRSTYDRVEEEFNIPQGNFGKWMRSKATVS
jgi:hypothetical protein